MLFANEKKKLYLIIYIELIALLVFVSFSIQN